jgi:hypothetical protein
MSDENANLLMQAMPDRGPGRVVMTMIATIIAVTTSAATYLFGADNPGWGAGVLVFGLVLAIVFFIYFKSHVLGQQCFTANLPFEIKPEHVQDAFKHIDDLRKECQPLVTDARVRTNIFRPSDEYHVYGCACILKIDPRLESGISESEVLNIRFLPGEGHTGKAFMTAKTSYGRPDVAITKEQLANISPDLAYVMSFPIKWKMGVLGVLNVDFCCLKDKSADADKEALKTRAETIQQKVEALAEKKAMLIASCLAKGKLQPIWLLRAP